MASDQVGYSVELTQEKIEQVCDNFKKFLLEKNKRYGDSAINPLKLFSKHEPDNPICTRLDEKLQRIQASEEGIRKNDAADCVGYLFLLCVQKGWLSFDEFLD